MTKPDNADAAYIIGKEIVCGCGTVAEAREEAVNQVINNRIANSGNHCIHWALTVNWFATSLLGTLMRLDSYVAADQAQDQCIRSLEAQNWDLSAIVSRARGGIK